MDDTIKNRQQDDYKFLGKEVAYYELIFRQLLEIGQRVSRGSDIINLVAHLEASFPYKDDEYEKAIKKAEKSLRDNFEAKDKYGRPDVEKRMNAVQTFTMIKYGELAKLFKRKKVFPQEAEDEWMQ